MEVRELKREHSASRLYPGDQNFASLFEDRDMSQLIDVAALTMNFLSRLAFCRRFQPINISRSDDPGQSNERNVNADSRRYLEALLMES